MMSNERSPDSDPCKVALSPQSIQVQRDVESMDDNIYGISEKNTFPFILYDVVSDPTTDDCIHWLPNGKLFLICDKKKFAKKVLPKFPGNGVFTSFTRRLKRWGFQRISSGPQIGAYKNENFMEGDKERIKNIKYMIPKRLSLVTIRNNMAKLQAAKTLNLVKALATNAISEDLSLNTVVGGAHVVMCPDLDGLLQSPSTHHLLSNGLQPQGSAVNPSTKTLGCILTNRGNNIAPNSYHIASMMMSQGPSLAVHLAMLQNTPKQQHKDMNAAPAFLSHFSTKSHESFGEMLVRTNPRLAAHLIESRGLFQGVQPSMVQSSDMMSLFTGNTV